jgi:hypothetical protein
MTQQFKAWRNILVTVVNETKSRGLLTDRLMPNSKANGWDNDDDAGGPRRLALEIEGLKCVTYWDADGDVLVPRSYGPDAVRLIVHIDSDEIATNWRKVYSYDEDYCVGVLVTTNNPYLDPATADKGLKCSGKYEKKLAALKVEPDGFVADERAEEAKVDADAVRDALRDAITDLRGECRSIETALDTLEYRAAKAGVAL